MISHDQMVKALRRQGVNLSDDRVNALLNDLLPNPQCGFSVSGFVVHGDKKSIDEVRHWHHDSTAVVPALRQRIIADGKLQILR